MKRVILSTLAAVLAVILFFFYSLNVSFSNWPWTRRQVVSHGAYLDFQIGDSKEEVLKQAIVNQQAERVSGLYLLDQAPVPYKKQFRGIDLSMEDVTKVSVSNLWHTSIEGKNAWIHLSFEQDKLATIVVHHYYGPTK